MRISYGLLKADAAQRIQILAMKSHRMGMLRWHMMLTRWKTAVLLQANRSAATCFCPCCNRICAGWVDWSPTYRRVICPFCESQPRHRGLILHLKAHTGFYRDPLEVLHLGPENCLRSAFARLYNLRYTTADLKRKNVDVRLDVVSMPFGGNVYDTVIASHILEHVEDDRAALREILRILKPGGFAFLQVPLDPRRATTLEDPRIRLPRERLKVFLQEDHVRLYGRDYVDRVSQAGFIARIENPVRELSNEQINKYGLYPSDDLVFGYKPI